MGFSIFLCESFKKGNGHTDKCAAVLDKKRKILQSNTDAFISAEDVSTPVLHACRYADRLQ